MIILPNYITAVAACDMPINHKWNDTDPSVFYPVDSLLSRKMSGICQRGIIVLSTGFVEWITGRFCKEVPGTQLLLWEIEAVLAGVIDWRYTGPLARSDKAPARKEWQGPVRGAMRAAFNCLSQIVALAKRSSFLGDDASCLARLAAHVSPDPKPLQNWTKFAISRLKSLYPLDPTDRLGPPIPRGVLNPEFDYKPEMASSLILEFLNDLDFEQNPFLRRLPQADIEDIERPLKGYST